jgi:hypothetical protein
MKIYTLMALLLAGAAFADEQPRMTSRPATQVEDVWMKLNALASLEPGHRLPGVKVSDPIAVQQYVEMANERLTALGRAFADDLCVNRPVYESSPDKLIERWERHLQDEDQLKQSIMEGLPEVLGKETAESFMNYVNSNKPATVVDPIDFRNNEAIRQKLLSRACLPLGGEPS